MYAGLHSNNWCWKFGDWPSAAAGPACALKKFGLLRSHIICGAIFKLAFVVSSYTAKRETQYEPTKEPFARGFRAGQLGYCNGLFSLCLYWPHWWSLWKSGFWGTVARPQPRVVLLFFRYSTNLRYFPVRIPCRTSFKFHPIDKCWGGFHPEKSRFELLLDGKLKF